MHSLSRHIVNILILVLGCRLAHAQTTAEAATRKQQYLTEQKTIGRAFTGYFYPRYNQLYALPAATFVAKIDSGRQVFETHLNRYAKQLEAPFVQTQQAEIRFYFDKLLLEYPEAHETCTGQKGKLPAAVVRRLNVNLAAFNQPEQLTNDDFKAYARAYVERQTKRELRKPAYARQDNQFLQATWQLLPTLFTNAQCRAYWQQEYLFKHLDNLGAKNLEAIVGSFNATCQDTTYRRKINQLYEQELAGRRGHLIKSYKTVGPYALDLHLFLPEASVDSRPKPTIVFFHGGSWSEGKPDWFFGTCAGYARRGWVACAVEYRVLARHNTLPFAAVMDAKSAIRWLRQHAEELQIDTARIVASGNSAGGHLALATALATNCNEKTDDLRWSAKPNALLVNAGVYDLTTATNAWISKHLKDKAQVRSISPVHLVGPGLPSMLLVHGTEDKNVAFATAEAFRQAATQAGNVVEFEALDGAEHFIWYNPRFAGRIAERHAAFLKKLGY
ncbi:alpha/beta hydrolase [uncultured Hymenobacter sp.]|uniref:alpha/beta hydrolase n=1 Tax=uncultured Hymenobacter sp. TaxID=170016 RepID=UPI0035CBDEA4